MSTYYREQTGRALCITLLEQREKPASDKSANATVLKGTSLEIRLKSDREGLSKQINSNNDKICIIYYFPKNES